ncbi:MAG: hypothetical protein WCJ37_17410, partial [Syntrophus sp. (in: bacteria)]
MSGYTHKKWHFQIFRSLWPAFLVLAINLVLSVFIGNFTFVGGVDAVWKIPFRYVRFSLTLVLPLFLLLPLSGFMGRLFTLGHRELIATAERETAVTPLKTWFIRPFQGIGLSLLIASKLIVILQGYSAVALGSAGALPPSQFTPGRMLASMFIAVIASLLLTLFWTLDDLGARQRNTKTGEVKMAGRYLGVILPILFGFTGFLNLLQDIPAALAVQYVLQIALALYPPFMTLAVCHAVYVHEKGDVLLRNLAVRPIATLTDG